MSWLAKVKRRRAGIYLARTRKHRGRGRENGYVGRSNNVKLRERCHRGQCSHAGCAAKPWIDLDPVFHWIVKLPWWLSWRWVQSPIEALCIAVLMPRYNVQLNKQNPRRVTPAEQRRQRAKRDRWRADGISPIGTTLSMRIARHGFRMAGAGCLLLALFIAVMELAR